MFGGEDRTHPPEGTFLFLVVRICSESGLPTLEPNLERPGVPSRAEEEEEEEGPAGGEPKEPGGCVAEEAAVSGSFASQL